MSATCYEIDQALSLKPLGPEEAVKASQRPEGRIWIDLRNGTTGEMEQWLERLEVTGLSRNLCREAHGRSGFYPIALGFMILVGWSMYFFFRRTGWLD